MLKVIYQIPDAIDIDGNPIGDYISTFADADTFVEWVEELPIHILLKTVDRVD